MRINSINNTYRTIGANKSLRNKPIKLQTDSINTTSKNNIAFQKNKQYTVLMSGSAALTTGLAISCLGATPDIIIGFVSLGTLCSLMGFCIDRSLDKD